MIADGGLKIYQNPARSKNLRIQYSLPRASSVKLIFYNSLGQVGQVLIDGEAGAGNHEISVKRKMSTGVYFVILKTEGKINTKKLIVIE